MPKFGVAITKTVLFRGVQQEFSNRYHYEGADMSTTQATQLAQNVKAAEVPLHSSDVTFKFYRVWLDTGSKATSLMISQGQLSGTGSTTVDASLDRERCVLIRWRAGNDSLGRAVYLRKYYHSCGTFNGVNMSSSLKQNTLAFSAGEKTSIEQGGTSLQAVSDGADTKTLAAPPGRTRTGGATAHSYLEHHQLGDQWRG